MLRPATSRSESSRTGCEQHWHRSSRYRASARPARSGGDRREGLLLARESERLVGREASRVHGAQHRHLDVGVVVDAHARLALVRAHKASGVLDEAALEGDGEGEEEGVELRAVEALAEVLPGRDDDEWFGSGCVLDLVEQGGACALAQTSLENHGRDVPAL